MSDFSLSRSVHVSFSIPSYVIPLSAISLCLFGASRLGWRSGSPEPLDHVVESPLKTILPKLSDDEKRDLPYPEDLFPGKRDVKTPWGSVRVYEWGPEDGRKVLLVHGISTPCLSLGFVAEHLVESGCRVMLYDLFGRGYSDDPSDLKHDSRLYTTQILLALASSAIAWTGTNAFSIVGYSLGGGIAASFTDTFPSLVSSLILLAPAGVVRLRQIAWSSKFLYQTEGILPEPLIIHYLVRRRLWSGTVIGTPRASASTKTDATSATAAELGTNPTSTLYTKRPHVDPTAAVQWQLEHHPGFVPAFISAIRYAPITNQHASWERIGVRIRAGGNEGLGPGKVLLMLGRTDPIVTVVEVGEDAEKCFGEGALETVVINGGHEIPMSHAREVADAVLRYWDEK